MNGVLISMSREEIDRLEITQQVISKHRKQIEAAKLLGLSTRQMRRLIKGYRQKGAKGLVSSRRGKSGNHRHNNEFKAKVMNHVREQYSDFGPTLASEKLLEYHQLSINRETLRQWMIEEDLWKRKQRSTRVTHQQRARRSCLGELIQIDGSPHDWFEGRAPVCCLLVFIDDATSRLMQLRFVETESTHGYFEATKAYIKQYGRPITFYSDKHGIFRVNIKEAREGTGETQFGRAMRELGIEIICAHSPQAKGRVERANQTLQDRLVKELRLNGISDIDSANRFLPRFITAYNKRFAVEPANQTDAHRKAIPSAEILDVILSRQHQRTLSKNLELSYCNVLYQIKTSGRGYNMRHAKVNVCEDSQGHVTLFYKGKKLLYTVLDKRNQPAQITDVKQLNHFVDRPLATRNRAHKPKADHPWKQYKRVADRKQRKASYSHLEKQSLELLYSASKDNNGFTDLMLSK